MIESRDMITARNLNRLRSMLQVHDAGAITSFRGEHSLGESEERSRELRAYLVDKFYSVFVITGSYIERSTDAAQEISEEALFAVDESNSGRLKDDLVKLGRLCDREAVLWIPRGESSVLIGTSRREEAYPRYNQTIDFSGSIWGKANGALFSRILGRQFLFIEEESMSLRQYEYPGTINGIRGMKICAREIEEEQLEALLKEMTEAE